MIADQCDQSDRRGGGKRSRGRFRLFAPVIPNEIDSQPFRPYTPPPPQHHRHHHPTPPPRLRQLDSTPAQSDRFTARTDVEDKDVKEESVTEGRTM